MLFGGYIKYPGSTQVLGSLSMGRRGVTGMSLRGRDFTGSSMVLTKRYFSPVEQFACRLTWWPHFYVALYLGLVPEKKLLNCVATILTAVALLLGRAHLDLWGDHKWTGGNHDFYNHGEIAYELMERPPPERWELLR